jgi:aspartate/tyrosine/aromatic aminotransferase
MEKKGHWSFFDSAYQGFATGDVVKDAFALRLFARSYNKVLLA